ncbi:hypothetical protein AWC27_28365 [Mycobacterium szulgai]|uniref:DUF222 domain-containing protein n=1 Tax=Mycobacterium szulgai TaxID=1787 RepID=A0A1X2EHY8_MYCSZ|nr:HNH endonuclease signature motif containing protein [Mycobacterium szulgai]ORX02681.1 hypothetical protein AWC27_28365 [Mycobacterium szulgai]
MSYSGIAGVRAAYDALDSALDAVLALDLEGLNTQELLAHLERIERVRRRLPAAEHGAINLLARQATAEELCGRLSHAVAEWTLTSRAEAGRRIREAADLGDRRALTGEPLAPILGATAAAQRDGKLGDGQVAVIRRFFQKLPVSVDHATRESAEERLAKEGTQFRPEQLAELAARLMNCVNPDGTYSDEDRARRRGLTLGKQQCDGMSELRAVITPELRATIEAVLAKLAAPGMCNPNDDTACVDGAPSHEAIEGDTRSQPQRNHDGLNAGLRAMLASGELGKHNGLPASIIVTTTLQELEAAAGSGLTGGGTLLPMSDVIRIGRHSHHYLAVFDKGEVLTLYHTKRLASPGQRIVLYAKDRGCSAPGCEVGGYYCEVQHVTDYAKCRATDIEGLTFACGPHHRMLRPGGWSTRKRQNGATEWTPPPQLDRGQPRINTFHHPEKLLRDGDDDDGD